MGLIQQFDEPNVITTSTDKVFNWARKNSLWPLQFGLACCAIEMMSTGMAHNDLERFGSSPFMGSPRQADVMIVSGTVSTKMAERMTRLYEQMAEPKWVIAMGACAISGGPFLDGYSVLMGADRVIPVDVYVPGCPPRPEALIFGIMALQKKVERDMQVGRNRPRASLVNEDGTINEYLPEREYTGMSEGIAERFEGVAQLKRTYTFERTGLPPEAMTDTGWVPPEVQKKLKEEEKAKKAAAAAEKKAAKEKADAEKAAAESEGEGGTATATAEKPASEERSRRARRNREENSEADGEETERPRVRKRREKPDGEQSDGGGES